jgi:hypothetical protein
VLPVLPVLLSALGGIEVLTAAGTRPALLAALGVVGGLALIAVACLRVRRTGSWVLLFLGTVPFAVATWWSVATPLTAVLAAGLGITLIRRACRTADVDLP